jgi:hypothetical protein
MYWTIRVMMEINVMIEVNVMMEARTKKGTQLEATLPQVIGIQICES